MRRIRVNKNVKSVIKPDVPLRANEIMIGNIIKTYQGQFIDVTSENISFVTSHIHEYRPVFITHEILTASGFIRRENQYEYMIDLMEDYYLFFMGRVGRLYKADRGAVGTPVFHVNHLQNLWFMLTGKQLKIVING
ncbi:MAG: hypothetical protein LUG18_10720 [Candidatus Azobacteroides sp.]|nr:hypothetical protein [Candidatus Azobacteroides sp.]